MSLNLTDPTPRLVRLLVAAVTVGAVMVPAGLAGAQPPPGPGSITDDQCEPTLEDCSPDTDPCAEEPEGGNEGECPEPCAEEPEGGNEGECPEPCLEEPEGGEESECPDPEPEPVDPPVDGDPNFTG
jgi:hypothetical protein